MENKLPGEDGTDSLVTVNMFCRLVTCRPKTSSIRSNWTQPSF